jgi:hypothetical protein
VVLLLTLVPAITIGAEKKMPVEALAPLED